MQREGDGGRCPVLEDVALPTGSRRPATVSRERRQQVTRNNWRLGPSGRKAKANAKCTRTCENMIVLDRQAAESLQMQIRRQIAISIVNRQYPLDEPLPSVRQLASELDVSTTTVAMAYGAPKSDGFVEV